MKITFLLFLAGLVNMASASVLLTLRYDQDTNPRPVYDADCVALRQANWKMTDPVAVQLKNSFTSCYAQLGGVRRKLRAVEKPRKLLSCGQCATRCSGMSGGYCNPMCVVIAGGDCGVCCRRALEDEPEFMQIPIENMDEEKEAVTVISESDRELLTTEATTQCKSAKNTMLQCMIGQLESSIPLESKCFLKSNFRMFCDWY
jgi:hypothetical protein